MNLPEVDYSTSRPGLPQKAGRDFRAAGEKR
jgi:hypothetical protein